MKVSVNAVWDETLAFIRAERALIVPLALGTLYLGAVLVIASMSFLPAIWGLVVMVAGAWSLAGHFALIDLVLEPRRSVSEALGLGLRRLPQAILVYIVIGAILFLLFVPLLYAIAQAGYGSGPALQKLSTDQGEMMKLAAALPSWANLYSTLIMVAVGFVFIRLLLWKAALTLSGRPAESLRQSWLLTRGRFWQLFGLALFTGILVQIVEWALNTALGATFLLIGRSLGSPVVAMVVPALIVSLVATAFQTLIVLFLAHYYRRVLL